jgi:hypothetical protein
MGGGLAASASAPRGFGLLHSYLHLQQERLEVFGPTLYYFRPWSPGFLQCSHFDGALGVPALPF